MLDLDNSSWTSASEVHGLHEFNLTISLSDWMIQAGGGVGAGDRFLLSQLFSQSEIETMNSDRLAVLYFLKVPFS
jgi:hypothetical protein